MKKKALAYILGSIAVLFLAVIILVYKNVYGTTVFVKNNKSILYIPTNSSYSQVLDTIEKNLNVTNIQALDWVAKRKNYPARVKSGRYVIESDLSYSKLINLLRSGRQTPVRVTFNNIRTLNQLAGKIGDMIEVDSSDIINFLSDESNYSSDGFKKENIIAMFIPNTYQINWSTDAKGLYTRMLTEYRKFWDENRLTKAKEKGLDPLEVSTLASIIDDEVSKPDEKPRIAGVYLNRLKKGMPLQACPTIKFALNDFTITRILKKYLVVDSPYNTYIHKGFPPGPIGCPSVDAIDAVLNAEKHDYIFFAAKADFSGYHNFSKTLSEHNHYAAMYQKELNKRKIFK